MRYKYDRRTEREIYARGIAHDSRLRHPDTGAEYTMKTSRWWITTVLLLSYWPNANAAISYRPETKVWVLQAGPTTYAMGVNERGELQPIYWGGRVARDADFSTPHSRPEVASFDLSNP